MVSRRHPFLSAARVLQLDLPRVGAEDGRPDPRVWCHDCGLVLRRSEAVRLADDTLFPGGCGCPNCLSIDGFSWEMFDVEDELPTSVQSGDEWWG